MSSFAIAVLCVLILTIIFYLMIVLGSFGVKLPKWLTITTGVFFILYTVFAIIGMVLMSRFEVSTLVVIILNLLFGIYALLIGNSPKRLKITVGVFAIIMIIISVIACFSVPSMYGSTSLNMGVSGL